MLQSAKQKEISLFLNAFSQAAIDLFSALSLSSIKAIGARQVEKPIPSADIYGTMKLTGHASGKIEIALDKNLARQISAKIGHCDPDLLDDKEINDGIGELINQIAGNTRTKLWDKGFKTEISIPVVSQKSNLDESISQTGHPIYVIDFDCSAGFVALQICLHFTNFKPVLVMQS